MIVVVTILSMLVLALSARMYLVEKNMRDLALEIIQLNFDLEDLSGNKIAEEWLNDWELGDTCCKD